MGQNKITYEQFLEKIIELLRKEFGTGYQLEHHKVLKNNGIVLDGLLINKPGEEMIPNIYLNGYYKQYLEHGDLKRIASDFIKFYQSSNNKNKEKSFSFDYEMMKDKIIFRVINYQKNQELLSKVPYDKVLDLAITYYCLVRSEKDGIGTIRITKEHLQLWGVTKEEIRKYAIENTPKLFPPEIKLMSSVLYELMEQELFGDINPEKKEYEELLKEEASGSELYVLTNSYGINGASCIFYPQVLEQFQSMINRDFYILPSSIHEVLLVPIIPSMAPSDMSEMVREVNQIQVPIDEVLSDNAYIYSLVQKELKQLFL